MSKPVDVAENLRTSVNARVFGDGDMRNSLTEAIVRLEDLLATGWTIWC